VYRRECEKIDRAFQYPVQKRDVEETKREVEGDAAEAGKQLCSVLLFHSRAGRGSERSEVIADFKSGRLASACRRPRSD
jgi:hypothetical protein